jgi:hypothetical protein
MADLMSHVLFTYVLLTVASWQIDTVTRPWIVLGMAGAAIPDLVKISIVLDASTIGGVLGMPFSYGPISTLGGVLVVAAAITLCFGSKRKRVYWFLFLGGVSSLFLDALRVYADGHSTFFLYPFVWWRPPTPNLYVTADPRVLLGFLLLGTLVFLTDRYLVSDTNRADSETASES